jgi:DNA-binding transcriptional regulator YdaS (Cro superfamily)
MTMFRDTLKGLPRGTLVSIARAIGRSHGAVWQWKEVPAEHVAAVESVTGIPRHKLRPDLYPIAREALPEAAA